MIASFRHTYSLYVGAVYPKTAFKLIIRYICPIKRRIAAYYGEHKYEEITYNKNTQMLKFYLGRGEAQNVALITAYVPFCEL